MCRNVRHTLFCTTQVHNEGGSKRVLVTKNLPGSRWLDVLIAANCRVEVCTSEETILDIPTIQKLMGDRCDGVIGQLTETWGAPPPVTGI